MRFRRGLTKQEQRRQRVAELLVARPGVTVRELAQELGCAVSTAHADLVAAREEWAARRRELIEQVAAEDLAQTDRAIGAIWPHVLAGKGWAVDRLVKLLTYRLRLLGLERMQHQVDISEIFANYLGRLAEKHAREKSEPAPPRLRVLGSDPAP